MSRPPATPRLAALDPVAVADAVQAQCVDHVHRLCLAIGYEAHEGAPGTLHAEVQALVEFAQRGAAWDWQDSADAWDAANTITAALYDSAANHGEIGELAAEADPETEIGVALVAVHCRVLIDQGQHVTARQLAALASIDAQHVRLLARNGELRINDAGKITAREARRLLGARGVAPYNAG